MNPKILVQNQKTFLKLATTQVKHLLRCQRQQWRWNLESGLNNNLNIWLRAALAWNLRQNWHALHHSTPTYHPSMHHTPWKSYTRQLLHYPHRRTRNFTLTITPPPHHRRQCHRHLVQKTYAHPARYPQTLEYPCQHLVALVTNVQTVPSPIQRTLDYPNINNTTALRLREVLQGNLSAVNIVLKCTHLSELSRCTFGLTRCLVNVISAEKHSPGRGCYRVTSAPILGRSHSLATTVAALSPTGQTCALTSKLTQMLKSIPARDVGKHSLACLCWAST